LASLHLFSNTDERGDVASSIRIMPSPMTRVGCANFGDFQCAMLGFAGRGDRFDRIAIDTHGNPGLISFGKEGLDAGTFVNFSRQIIVPLCDPGAHVYFSGCNVAEGDEGWGFLRAAGYFFLRGSGGRVSGWTSLGFTQGLFDTGHTYHLWGKVRTAYCGADGQCIGYAEK